jgi:predicted DNA-binding WGR domain protein
VEPIARGGHFALLDSRSTRAEEFAKALRQLRLRHEAVAEARQATKAWREKLPADEVPVALEQARSFEGSFLAWLKPAWWRLRAILGRCYDFRSHVVRPSWTHVLTALGKEYALLAELDKQRKDIAATYEIEGDVDELVKIIGELQAAIPGLPDWIVPIHAALVRSDKASRIVERVTQADDALKSLTAELDTIAEGHHDYPLDRLRANLREVMGTLDDLPAFLQCLSEVAAVPEPLGTALRTLPLPPVGVEAATADRALEDAIRAERDLGRFSGATRRRHVNRLERLYGQWLEGNATDIRRRAHRRFLENIHIASLPAAQLTGDEKEFKRLYNRGRRELEHEFGKSMRYKSIRDLVSDESGEVVKDLKPVWLMSPLSVSDTLPLDTKHFDVVIFDEASQITLEEAIPSVFRACQAIVVGDEMQLPPTDFFSAKRDREDEEELLVEEDGELVEYDLESNSFLNHAAKNLPSTMLGWHYRSRSESLISYSNWTFYDGRLLTVPEEHLPAADRTSLRATDPADAELGAAELLQRSISFHFMEQGVYEKRRNRAEADYVAHLVRELLRGRSGRSIGIVAFSEAQQDEIEGALQRLAQSDAEFGDLLDAEQEREVDGQFVGLLVKNLENIQGDERDVIILSVCYGYGPNGKMLMNFGPINKSGGEKRLNVAFSRAKHHMALVSSIRHADITNDYNDGANCLKNYLRYAEAVSNGNTETARRVLHGMSRWHDSPDERDAEADDPVAGQLAEALAVCGFLVDRSVGQSHFRCDLAVRRDGDNSYRLGILLDNRAYYEQSDLLERDMMRPKLLRDFGWRVAFVLAKDWHEDREAVMDRLLRLLDGHDEYGEDEDLEDEDYEEDEPEEEVSGESASDEILDLGPTPLPGIDSHVAPEKATTEPGPQSTATDGQQDSAKPVATASTINEGQTRRFEFTSDTSNKFWEITFSGSQHTVRFGRIGTRGQIRTKQFDDPAEAKRDCERLIRSKLAKGYREH